MDVYMPTINLLGTSNDTKEKVNEKMSRRLEKWSKSLIKDGANVAALIRIDASFYDSGKIDWFEFQENDWFNNAEYLETDWDNVTMDINQEVYYCKRTRISAEYVNWFKKIAAPFNFERAIRTNKLRLFESKKANSPVLIIYGDIGMVLAPRVDQEDQDKFVDFKEEE